MAAVDLCMWTDVVRLMRMELGVDLDYIERGYTPNTVCARGGEIEFGEGGLRIPYT